MEAVTYIVPLHLMYINIPAKTLLTEVDKLFPELAKNKIADSVAGMGHRYKAGHDLLLDVPNTIHEYGVKEGLRHAGHIVLTDFPTKAGIPIPAFSQSGLGELLEDAGIHKGWLQVNFSDAGLGVFAISEGATDISLALDGAMDMNFGTFFDTFAEGSIEIAIGISTENPFMVVGGIENFLAGIISTWKTISVYVDPLDFLGSTGFSALLGFSVAYGLADKSLCEAGKYAVRSGVIGSLFSLSSAFGFGALAGFSAYRLGQMLSEQQSKSENMFFSVDVQEYQLLVDEICMGNTHVSGLLEKTHSLTLNQDGSNDLRQHNSTLIDNAPCVIDNSFTLESKHQGLSIGDCNISSDALVLQIDPQPISDWYSHICNQQL